jgi:hypothetical protein
MFIIAMPANTYEIGCGMDFLKIPSNAVFGFIYLMR